MGLITPDALPVDPINALRELARCRSELVRCESETKRLRRERIKDARSAGVSWKQIGEVLGMTEQSALGYFTRSARTAIAGAAKGNEVLDEDVAVRLSVQEVRTVRQRRRSA